MDEREFELVEERDEENKSFSSMPPNRRKHIAIAVGTVLALGIALFVLPIPLGNIQVSGTQKMTAQDIIVAGDIKEPVNVLQIKSSKLEETLSHDLRIESAKVRYIFPLTLQVDVVERMPVAVAVTQFGYASLDKNGQVIKLGTAIEDTKATILSGVRLGNVLLGDTVTNQGILDGLAFLKSLSPEGSKQIAEVNVGESSSLIAYTVDGLPIKLGDGTQLAEKASLAEDMIKDIKTRNVNAIYIDVNVKAPFIKMQ